MDGISEDTLKSYEIYLSRFSDYLSPETYPIYQNRVSKMNINESISENFRKLSCGLMQQNYPVVYKAHKNLYEIGQPVVPILKEKIIDIEWSNSRIGRLYSGSFLFLRKRFYIMK